MINLVKKARFSKLRQEYRVNFVVDFVVNFVTINHFVGESTFFNQQVVSLSLKLNLVCLFIVSYRRIVFDPIIICHKEKGKRRIERVLATNIQNNSLLNNKAISVAYNQKMVQLGMNDKLENTNNW